MGLRLWTGILSMVLAMAARHQKAGLGIHSLDESWSLPHHITRALRRASRTVDKQVEEMEKAETEAGAKKASMEKAAQEKLALVKEVENKTVDVKVRANKTRSLSIEASKAATAHMASGQDHQAALVKFSNISQEADGLAEEIQSKTSAFLAQMEKLKTELEDLKSKHAKKVQDADAAKQEANDLEAKLLAANKHKEGLENDHVTAQKAMNDAEKELRDLEAKLDQATSAASVAEAEESQASSFLRQAESNHQHANRAKDLLTALRNGVQTFYKSIRTLEASMEESASQGGKPYDRIKKDPNLKAVYTNYNLVAAYFKDILSFDEELYNQVRGAQPFIWKNAAAEIVWICDPHEDFGELPDDISKLPGTELNEKCGQGLWKAMEMTPSSME